MQYEIISLQPLRIENSSYSEALSLLIKDGTVEIKFIEFSLFKQVSIILHGFEDKRLFLKIFTNIYEIIKLLFSENKTLIIGAAPFSIVVFLLNKLKLKHKCIYYTSWPYWDGKKYLEKIYFASQMTAWREFLNGTISAGVTKASCEGVAKYGAKSFYMPHSVDTDLFVPASHKTPSDKVRVLYVGKFLRIKGMPLLVNLIKKYSWQNIEFLVAGGGPYEKEIVRLQNENYPVRYLGFIRDKKELVSIYQNSDIVILPSFHENFGIVLIEAMSCQIPVISSDCAGPSEIVDDGENGFLVAKNDEAGFRDAILKLEASADLRNQFGRNGREKVIKMYDVKEAAMRWKNVIEMVHHT
ncbi:MAG: glycosyltransferase family 4 protein [bacterium]